VSLHVLDVVAVFVSAVCSAKRFPALLSAAVTLKAHAYIGKVFTQPLTEMSTRNIKIIMFLGSKVRLVHRADRLTSIYELIV
jgi:hypothetical protein